METIEITKEDFEDYERIRLGGRTNMFDILMVCFLSNGLTKDKCLAIMKGYEELAEKYPGGIK